MTAAPDASEWAEPPIALLDSKELQQIDEPIVAEGAEQS